MDFKHRAKVPGGGAPGTRTIFVSAELYNPATGTLRPTGSMDSAQKKKGALWITQDNIEAVFLEYTGEGQAPR
jgi:hypothetical protein